MLLAHLEFLETCLECWGNVREFYFGGLVGTLSMLQYFSVYRTSITMFDNWAIKP